MKRKVVNVFIVFILLLVIIPIFAFAGGQGEAEKGPIVLRFGHIMPPTNTQGQGIELFAKLVDEKTNGEVKIEVFHSAQLGTQAEQSEMLRLGSLDFFTESIDYFSNMEETWKVVGWPFAFKSQEHFDSYINSKYYQQATERLEKEYNMKAISINWIRGPFKVILTKRSINNLADFQKIPFRISEVEIQKKCWGALGATPIPVPWMEVFLALKQGIVDAMESPFDVIYDMKFHQVAPNILMSKNMYQRLLIVMNPQKFDSLSKKHQQALLEAVDEAGDWYSEQTLQRFEENKKRLTAEGAQLIELDFSEWRQKSLNAALEFEKQGEWPAGTIQNMILDTEP